MRTSWRLRIRVQEILKRRSSNKRGGGTRPIHEVRLGQSKCFRPVMGQRLRLVSQGWGFEAGSLTAR